MVVEYTRVTSRTEVSQILDLQTLNLATAISPEAALSDGFLTVQHDPEVLWRMNRAEPSIVAKVENTVIGYALVMLPHFADEVPILKPMFEMLGQLNLPDWSFKDQSKWFVMGQICVDKGFRGMGVFDGLYHKMNEVFASKYHFMVTEVAERNTRSMRAHERVGFQTIHQYQDHLTGETWRLINFPFTYTEKPD